LKGAAIIAIFNAPAFLYLNADRGDGYVKYCEGKIIKIKAKRELKQRKKPGRKKRRRPDYHDGKRCSATRSLSFPVFVFQLP